jgi:hypothetical protein
MKKSILFALAVGVLSIGAVNVSAMQNGRGLCSCPGLVIGAGSLREAIEGVLMMEALMAALKATAPVDEIYCSTLAELRDEVRKDAIPGRKRLFLLKARIAGVTIEHDENDDTYTVNAGYSEITIPEGDAVAFMEEDVMEDIEAA